MEILKDFFIEEGAVYKLPVQSFCWINYTHQLHRTCYVTVYLQQEAMSNYWARLTQSVLCLL